jgi:hypothetical protein
MCNHVDNIGQGLKGNLKLLIIKFVIPIES